MAQEQGAQNAPALEKADVVVIGGGASGALLVCQLLRQSKQVRVILIESGDAPGRGIAYSTQDPDHLLNTRVGAMSAFPDEPHHLAEWLRARAQTAHIGGADFISRGLYGDYLVDLLEQAKAQAGERLQIVKGRCIALREGVDGVEAELTDGAVLHARRAVLATGHVVPEPAASPLILRAWDPLGPVERDATVVIVGTGLSMVDQLLSLERQGHQGPVIALSRRGLLPRAHTAVTPLPITREEVPIGQPVSQLLGWLRGKAREAEALGGSWRDAVEGIRPYITDIWQGMDNEMRARFLRHGASWWEVHRHRIPPESAARVEAAMEAGRLRIRRAAYLNAQENGAGELRVELRPRDSQAVEVISAQRLIDCRGIRNDPQRHAAPLMAGLLQGGSAVVDPLRVGVEVALDCALLDQEGVASEQIFALGPVSRARFWEITAIPDIRLQAQHLATRLLG